MSLDNYPCFSLQHCYIEAFSENIKQVDNLGRLTVTGSHIDSNIKLRIIAYRRTEIALNQ